MTTIAWRRDSRQIGADRQNSYHKMPVDKLYHMPDGSVIGGSGSPGSMVQACISYLRDGGDKPELTDSMSIELLRAYPDGRAEVIFNLAPPVPIQLNYFAVGSGADYAMGAMHAGTSVTHALQAAHTHNADTGPFHHIITVGAPHVERERTACGQQGCY